MTVAISNTGYVMKRLGRTAEPLTTQEMLTDPADGSQGRIHYLTLHNAQSATRRLEKQGFAKRNGRRWSLTEAGKEAWCALAHSLDLEP